MTFSNELILYFRQFTGPRTKNEREYFNQKNCIFKEGKGEIRLLKVFEEYLYLPVAQKSMRLAKTVARFQNGCLDASFLYVFVTVIALVVYLGWFA